MPNYHIQFVGAGAQNRPPADVVCVDDQQALDWAASLLAHHLGAEVSNDGRQVGWVTTADNQAGVSIVLACS
jgi:hypothetical protein